MCDARGTHPPDAGSAGFIDITHGGLSPVMNRPSSGLVFSGDFVSSSLHSSIRARACVRGVSTIMMRILMEKEYVQYGVWVSDCCLIVCLCLSVSVCVWFLLVSWLSFHSSKSYPPHTHVRTHRPTRAKKSVSFVRSFVRSEVKRPRVESNHDRSIDRSLRSITSIAIAAGVLRFNSDAR